MHVELYRSLYRIRRVEEELARIYPSDDIKSPVHLSIGQEAVSVGVCQALSNEDVVFGTYRGHALYLAKGGDLSRMLAELYGKVTGVTGGKGGSMHLIDRSAGVLGTSAIVGTTTPQAIGYAYALKLQKKTNIVASFFGDGATEAGSFHESLNFAALKNLPILFVCENNYYSIHTPQPKRQALDNIWEKAAAYGIPSIQIEDSDIYRISEWATNSVDQIKNNGSGPHFLECRTYRWKEHVGPNEDYDAGYRARSEAQPWIDNDQLLNVKKNIAAKALGDIEAEVEKEIAQAFQYASDSHFPGEAELLTNVFKETS